MRSLALFLFGLVVQMSSAPAAIIGPDNLTRVNGLGLNVPAPLHRFANAVGFLSMSCTGTHLGHGYVITAGHCLHSSEKQLFNVPCPENTTVQWGVRGDQLGMISKCLRVIGEQTTNGADWAIFQVDRAPSAFVEVDVKTPLWMNQRLTTFSHPESKPLEWSRFCRVIMPFPRPPYGVQGMYHVCDTQPGSSGAALVDATTFKMVAVHNGGDPRANYGTVLSSPLLAQTLMRILRLF